MTLQLYLDDALTQPVSSGDFSQPDTDTYNGTTGETKDRPLYLANTQTTLTQAISATATQLTLARVVFNPGEIISCEDEQMQVVALGSGRTVIVTRGMALTSAKAHAKGAVLITASQYTDIVMQAVDTRGAGKAAWYTLATSQQGLDTASAGAALDLGRKDYHDTLTVWRRCRVPSGTPVQNNLDVQLRLTATASPLPLGGPV